MEYNKEMFLESPSGFMMPFTATKEDSIQISLGYGDQVHPQTGEHFNHAGYDFAVQHVPLYAMASGVVSGLGNDPVHEQFIICRYGNYDVKYGHIDRPFVNYGQALKAGQSVAMSGDFLHFEVRFKGEVLDPKVFIDLIYGNIMQLSAMGMNNMPGMKQPVTSYDSIQDDVLDMMLRYWPSYMNALQTGRYAPPFRLQQGMRQLLAQAAAQNSFFEEMPSIGNPLGLGTKSIPLIGQVQDYLISDFLSYVAMSHGLYPPSWDENQKKNFLDKWQLMESSVTH